MFTYQVSNYLVFFYCEMRKKIMMNRVSAIVFRFEQNLRMAEYHFFVLT